MTSAGPDRQGDVFGRRAADYATARPDYAPEIFDAIWTHTGMSDPVAVDLAAGAGAVTADLVGRGARVLAIEPSLDFHHHLRAIGEGSSFSPDIAAGRAEALPVRPRSVDVVTIGQAFHWFDQRLALDEIASIIRPDGILALMWNVEENDAFMGAVLKLLARFNPGYYRPVNEHVLLKPEALRRHPAFQVEPSLLFRRTRPLSEDDYIMFASSWSYAGGSMAPDVWFGFQAALRQLFREYYGSSTREDPFLSVAHLARRR